MTSYQLGIPTSLAWKHSLTPLAIFLSISLSYLYIEENIFSVIRYNYNICHFLYGAAFPLVFGYIGPITPKREDGQHESFREFVSRVLSVPAYQMPGHLFRALLRELTKLRKGLSWSPFTGAIFVGCFSIGNELIQAPLSNNVSFFNAYSHFVSDILGITAFLGSVWLCSKLPIIRKHSR